MRTCFSLPAERYADVLSTTPDAGWDEGRSRAPSMLERMTLIVDAFEGPSTQLSLEDVARRTHLPRSTAHRILDQLVRLRWLERTSFGYVLGYRVLGCGRHEGMYAQVRSAAAPLLHELHMTTGMVVHLAVLDGAEVYYLDKVGGQFVTVVPSRVGGRAPAHCTALGKAILAWLTPEQVDIQLGGRMDRPTNRTIADLDTLHQELDRIRRRRGLTFDRGECCTEISCVAAAICGPERPVASISLVGGQRVPLEKVAPLVVNAARQASDDLFPPQRSSEDSPARGRRASGNGSGECCTWCD